MAYKSFDESSINSTHAPQNEQISLKIDGPQVQVPDASFIKDSAITRDGADLVLTGADSTVVIEGYYNAETAPDIVSADGSSLTPALVNSFSTSDARFASADAGTNDSSPVGAVNEVSGNATVTRLDGSTETVQPGTPIFQGDIVETDANGAVNIVFQDETKFAISEDARLAIDEFVYDPTTDAGETNFSVLKGVFVYTSGLIGREDPDDVHIETPVGSIGIRGTIIAGDVNQGEITVVEGAIVLNDFNGNEITLANQFETAKFGGENGGIQHMGQLAANDVAGKFSGVSSVAPDLFSSINDAAQETQQDNKESSQGNEENAAQADEQDVKPEDTEAQDAATEGEPAAAEGEPAPEESKAETEGKEDAPADAQDGEKAEAKAKEEAAKAAEEGREPAERNAEGKEAQGKEQQANDPQADPQGKPAEQGQQPNTPADNQGAHNFGENAGQAIGTEALNFSLGTNQGAAGRNPAAGPNGNGPRPLGPDAPPPPPIDPTTGTNTGSGGTAAGTGGAFALNVDTPALQENTPGGVLGTVSGINGIITSISFIDPIASNFIDISLTSNGWEFKLKPGEALDFEDTAGINIEFTATVNAPDGTASVNGNLTPFITNENEDIQHMYSELQNTQVAHEGSTFTFNFDNDFHDPDGDSNLTFEIVSGSIGGTIDGTAIASLTDSVLVSHLDTAMGTNGVDFNAATGELTFFFKDGTPFTAVSNLVFEVKATDINDASDTLTQSYSLDLLTATTDDSGLAAGVTSSFSTGTETVISTIYNDMLDITSNGNNIFANDGADSVSIDGTNNFVNGGKGNDILTLNSGGGNRILGGQGDDTFHSNSIGTNNKLLGGQGDDTFFIENGVHNTFLGGEGHDTFIFDMGVNANALKDLESSMFSRVFEGNGGYDILRLDGGSGATLAQRTLDFTNAEIDNISGGTKFHSIEEIDLSDAGNYKVKLTADDIFDMTDDQNQLVINGDAGDTVDLTSDGGKAFVNEGFDGTYNTYSNGDVTLIVDADVNVVGALAGL